MKCDEALKRIPGLALEELDVEVRREVETHLASCGACRAAGTGQERTLAALRALPAVETSADRREDTVRGMLRARDELVERAILVRPARWGAWTATASAAALLFLAFGWMALGPAAWKSFRVKGAGIDLQMGGVRVEAQGEAEVIVSEPDRLVVVHGSVRVETDRPVTVANLRQDWFVLEAGRARFDVNPSGVAGVTSDDPRRAEPRFEGHRFRVRLERGVGTLGAENVSPLKLEPGQSGRIDEAGRPVR